GRFPDILQRCLVHPTKLLWYIDPNDTGTGIMFPFLRYYEIRSSDRVPAESTRTRGIEAASLRDLLGDDVVAFFEDERMRGNMWIPAPRGRNSDTARDGQGGVCKDAEHQRCTNSKGNTQAIH
ncbi:MAG: hypothetical protein Q9170_006278, partial [Blastenia crenularia]